MHVLALEWGCDLSTRKKNPLPLKFNKDITIAPERLCNVTLNRLLFVKSVNETFF